MAGSKPTRPDANNPMSALATVAVAQNPELRDRLVKVFNLAIDDVERVFRFGDVRDRAIYARQLVPAMLRGMQEAEGSAASAAMQSAFDRIMEAVGGPMR